MPEQHDGEHGTRLPWPAPGTLWPAPTGRRAQPRRPAWAPPSPGAIVGFVASAHTAPAAGTALRSAALEPPHPALRPVAWGRWPGYAPRPISEPVEAASIRSVFETADDEVGDAVVVPLLPATTADDDRLAAVASHAAHESAQAAPPSAVPPPIATPPSRRPVLGWAAAAAIVGVGLGVIVAPQRTQAPEPTLLDDRAQGAESTGPTIAPTDTATATTPLVAQLPPTPPAPGDRDVVIDTDFSGVGDEEWIRLTNTSGSDLDLTGWQVSDDGRNHVYVFGPFMLTVGSSVTISSGCGADTPTERYWCAVDDIWNDGGDVVTVVTADGTLVATTTG